MTNLQQLRDTILSIRTKISEECFQNLVESMPRRIKAVLKAKGGYTPYMQCLFIHTGRRRALSCRKSYQEILNMDKCPAITAVFTEKKTQTNLELRLHNIWCSIWFICVFHLQVINKVYEQCRAN